MSYGITPQGFVRKPYSVILKELQDQARLGEYFGPDIDLSDASPVGIEIKLKAWALDRQWALAESVYYSLWIDTAEGVSLDRVAGLGLVERNPARHSLVELEFSGDPAALVPIGSQAETAQNIVFETIEEGVLDGEGTVTVWARCTQTGTIGNVPHDSITSIKEPIPNVDAVNNPNDASGGRPIESDPDLRAAYEDLPVSTGSSVDAVFRALMAIAGVTNARVIENKSNIEDENGLPPRSICAVVSGGLDADIAEAIFPKVSAGIETYGAEAIEILDEQEFTHEIHFARPTSASVYVIYNIVTNSEWSDDNITEMKRNAVKYIGGIDDQSVEYSGIGSGSSLIAWKLNAVQAGIAGIDEIEVLFGRTANPTGNDKIDFLIQELPRTAMANITVNVP
jgi:uncharacterized phage protein gp47/JayE